MINRFMFVERVSRPECFLTEGAGVGKAVQVSLNVHRNVGLFPALIITNFAIVNSIFFPQKVIWDRDQFLRIWGSCMQVVTPCPARATETLITIDGHNPLIGWILMVSSLSNFYKNLHLWFWSSGKKQRPRSLHFLCRLSWWTGDCHWRLGQQQNLYLSSQRKLELSVQKGGI